MRDLIHPLVDLDARWCECRRAPEGYTTWPRDGLIGEIMAGPTGMTEYAQGIAILLASYAADGLAQVPADIVADTVVADDPGLYGRVERALRELADYGYIDLVGGDPA